MRPINVSSDKVTGLNLCHVKVLHALGCHQESFGLLKIEVLSVSHSVSSDFCKLCFLTYKEIIMINKAEIVKPVRME